MAPEGLCGATSKNKLYIKGQFNLGRISADPPLIYFKVNKTTELFKFIFNLGADRNSPNSYSLWSVINGVNQTDVNVTLSDFNKTNPEFNMTISCVDLDNLHKFKEIYNLFIKSIT